MKVAIFICSTTLVVGMVGIAEAISFTEIFKLYNGTGSIPVPDPATLLLLGSGLICLSFFGRKKFPLKPK